MLRDPIDLEDRVLRILPGLLASGAYTVPYDEQNPNEDEGVLRYVRYGKDWKEFTSAPVLPMAIADAIELVRELHWHCEWEKREDAQSEAELAEHEKAAQA